MDAYDQAQAKRRTLLRTPCGLCGVGSGWCVDAGGHDIRNVFRQHAIRYSLARVQKTLLRALFSKVSFAA